MGGRTKASALRVKPTGTGFDESASSHQRPRHQADPSTPLSSLPVQHKRPPDHPDRARLPAGLHQHPTQTDRLLEEGGQKCRAVCRSAGQHGPEFHLEHRQVFLRRWPTGSDKLHGVKAAVPNNPQLVRTQKSDARRTCDCRFPVIRRHDLEAGVRVEGQGRRCRQIGCHRGQDRLGPALIALRLRRPGQ